MDKAFPFLNPNLFLFDIFNLKKAYLCKTQIKVNKYPLIINIYFYRITITMHFLIHSHKIKYTVYTTINNAVNFPMFKHKDLLLNNYRISRQTWKVATKQLWFGNRRNNYFLFYFFLVFNHLFTTSSEEGKTLMNLFLRWPVINSSMKPTIIELLKFFLQNFCNNLSLFQWSLTIVSIYHGYHELGN